eukprot:TCONS_00047730-protein
MALKSLPIILIFVFIYTGEATLTKLCKEKARELCNRTNGGPYRRCTRKAKAKCRKIAIHLLNGHIPTAKPHNEELPNEGHVTAEITNTSFTTGASTTIPSISTYQQPLSRYQSTIKETNSTNIMSHARTHRVSSRPICSASLAFEVHRTSICMNGKCRLFRYRVPTKICNYKKR